MLIKVSSSIFESHRLVRKVALEMSYEVHLLSEHYQQAITHDTLRADKRRSSLDVEDGNAPKSDSEVHLCLPTRPRNLFTSAH